MSATNTDAVNKLKQKKQREQSQFPHKLWLLLSECNDGAVRWGETGDYIAVDQSRFSESLAVVKIFRTIKLSSFIRQLNLYGFRKFFPNHKQEGPCTCKCHIMSPLAYYQHIHFQRGGTAAECLTRITRPHRPKNSVNNGNVFYAEFPHLEPMIQIKCDNTTDPQQELIWNVATVPELPTDSNFNQNSVVQFPEEKPSYLQDDTTYPFIKNSDSNTVCNTTSQNGLTKPLTKVELVGESYMSETCNETTCSSGETWTEASPFFAADQCFQFLYQSVDSDDTKQSILPLKVGVMLSTVCSEEPMDIDVEIEF